MRRKYIETDYVKDLRYRKTITGDKDWINLTGANRRAFGDTVARKDQKEFANYLATNKKKIPLETFEDIFHNFEKKAVDIVYSELDNKQKKKLLNSFFNYRIIEREKKERKYNKKYK